MAVFLFHPLILWTVLIYLSWWIHSCIWSQMQPRSSFILELFVAVGNDGKIWTKFRYFSCHLTPHCIPHLQSLAVFLCKVCILQLSHAQNALGWPRCYVWQAFKMNEFCVNYISKQQDGQDSNLKVDKVYLNAHFHATSYSFLSGIIFKSVFLCILHVLVGFIWDF